MGQLLDVENVLDVENAHWSDQHLSDLATQRPRKINFFIQNTNCVTVSSEEYYEQKAYAIEVPFEKIDYTLSDHIKILKFLNGSPYKKREDLQTVVTPRILELINDIEEEADEEQDSIDFNSFKGFIHFLAKNGNVEIPSFVITCRGYIRALWRKSKKQHFAAEFHHDGTVTYVVFAPNLAEPGKIMRSSGWIGQKLLCKVAVSLGADKWIFK